MLFNFLKSQRSALDYFSKDDLKAYGQIKKLVQELTEQNSTSELLPKGCYKCLFLLQGLIVNVPYTKALDKLKDRYVKEANPLKQQKIKEKMEGYVAKRKALVDEIVQEAEPYQAILDDQNIDEHVSSDVIQYWVKKHTETNSEFLNL